MNNVDFSGYIVIYNLVIGVLLILSSDKVGTIAGSVSGSYRQSVARVAKVSTCALGSTVTALMAFIYVAFHLLKVSV